MTIEWGPPRKPHLKGATKEWKRDNERRYARHAKVWLAENVGAECVWCGSTENLEYDHINPGLKREGNCAIRLSRAQEDVDNLRCLCHTCHARHSNQQKHTAYSVFPNNSYKEAYQLFISLPLHEQEHLIEENYPT